MEYKIIKNDTNYNLDDLTKLLNTSYLSLSKPTFKSLIYLEIIFV